MRLRLFSTRNLKQWSILTLLLASLSWTGAKAGPKTTHFVLDLDDVIFSNVSIEEASSRHIHGVTFDDRVYFANPAAAEFISSLLDMPDSDVSVFSAGSPERVKALLSELLVTDRNGEKISALQAISKVATNRDLIKLKELPPAEAERVRSDLPPFHGGKTKKDLTKIVPKNELSNTIFIDNRAGNVIRGQERCLLWVKPLVGQVENPRSVEPLLNQNQLARVRAQIERARETANQTGESITSALFNMQWERLPDRYEYRVSNYLDRSLYSQGEHLLGIHSSQIHELTQAVLPPASFQFASDHDKVEQLFFAREFIPSLISQSSQFDFSPLQIMDGEEQLLRVLERNPSYRAQLTNKREYLQITLTDPNARIKKVKGRMLLPDATEPFRSSVKRTFSEIADAKDMDQAILDRTKQLSTEVGRFNSQDVSSAIVKLLPRETQKDAFKADLTKRLTLFHSIEEQPVPAELRSVNGWPEHFTVKDAIEKIRQLKMAEDELGRLSLAWALVRSAPSSELARETLRSPSATIVDPILDPQELRRQLTPFYSAAENNGFRVLTDDQLKWINDSAVPFTSVYEKEVSDSFDMTLVEVPPEVANYRGCAAGNCVTQKEFPTPNAPDERTFFIYKKNSKELIGLLEWTDLPHNHEGGVIYINTLNGARLGTKETSLLLRGLQALKKPLKISEIQFPDPKRFNEMFNNPLIAEEVSKHLDMANLVRITYRKPEIRELIENFKHANNYAEYDKMKNNQLGAKFNLDPEEAASVRVEIRPVVFPTKAIPTLERQDAIGIALDIHSLRHPDDFKRIASVLSLDTEKLLPFFHIIDNEQKLPAKKYLEAIHEALRKENLPESIISQRPSLIRQGWFRAPDALSDENLSTTREYFSKEIKTGKITSGLVDFSRANWDRLISDASVLKSVQTLINGSFDDVSNLRKFLPLRPGAIPESLRSDLISGLSRIDIKNAALQLLPYLGPDPARPHEDPATLVVHALRDSDEQFAGEAGSVLLKFQHESEYLAREIRRAAIDPKVPLSARQSIITKLAKQSPVDAKLAIEETFKGTDSNARLLFALTAGSLPDPELASLIQAAYHRESGPSGDPKIKRNLIPAMMAHAKSDAQLKKMILEVAAKDSDASVRRQVALSLTQASVSDANWLPHALQFKSDPDPTNREALARELGTRVPTLPSAQDALLELATDSNFLVRDAAQYKLSSIISLKNTDPNRASALKRSLEEIREFGKILTPNNCIETQIEKRLNSLTP